MEDFLIELIGGAAELVFDIVLDQKSKRKKKEDNDMDKNRDDATDAIKEYRIED